MSETNRVKRDNLKARVAKSLEALRSAMGWTKNEFAEKLDVAPASYSNYTNTDNDKLPDLVCLVNLCRIPDFKRKGLDLSIDTILSPHFDPVSLVRNREGTTPDIINNIKHKDFLGTYLCYFFDQTKSFHDQDFKASRDLRYGVVCFYDDYKGVTGDAIIRVYATFYKNTNEEIASSTNLKNTLDAIFENKGENGNVSTRNEKIREAFSGVGNLYEGTVDFSEQHVFVNIHSDVINDQALMILPSPHKRSDMEYIGGIGCVASVAHGRSRMPTAQKIIISKYMLNCSNEEISEYLNMSTAPVASNNEAQALSEICRKLYGKDSYLTSYFDEGDRIAIITNRMNQLVRNYIEKNVCCVGSVSDEDDKKVYELIKRKRI